MKSTPNAFRKRVGNTTFIVNVKQSETAKKPLEAKFRELCIHEALGNFDFSDCDLEKLKKSS